MNFETLMFSSMKVRLIKDLQMRDHAACVTEGVLGVGRGLFTSPKLS